MGAARGILTRSRGRRAFREAGLENDLTRHGYAIVDLLTPAEVRALIEQHDALGTPVAGVTSFAPGLHTTMFDPRPDYRAAVRHAIAGIVQPAIDRVMDRHEILVANFMVKAPGAHAVPPHHDWTFVDEPAFRSVGVWCPLVDTDVTNGGLGVVPDSHLAAPTVRPVNDRWYGPEEATAGVAVVPLSAGQALVYDSRAIHFSGPNTARGTRPVAACIVAPVGATLVHDWIDDRDRPRRLRIETGFFLNYAIGSVPLDAPGVLGEIPTGGGAGRSRPRHARRRK